MDITLKDFQGPLDLLLHLVSKYQMDIYDVPLIEVIEQYLAYVDTLSAMRLELAGEYMVMASQLTLIKSRRLLPKVVEDSPDELDPERALLEQLEEYRIYKALSQELESLHNERTYYYSKPKQELVYDDIPLNQDKTPIDLFLAFSKVMTQKQEEIRTGRATIVRETYAIEDMIAYLRDAFFQQASYTLEELTQDYSALDAVITIFLAILELVKRQEVIVEQEGFFGAIRLKRREDVI